MVHQSGRPITSPHAATTSMYIDACAHTRTCVRTDNAGQSTSTAVVTSQQTEFAVVDAWTAMPKLEHIVQDSRYVQLATPTIAVKVCAWILYTDT